MNLKEHLALFQRNGMKRMHSETLLRIEKILLVWRAQLRESAVCAAVVVLMNQT